MATLAQSQHAFLPGCDLWIVSQRVPKAFSLRLDWLLNFQLSKGQRHVHRDRPEATEAWVARTGLELPARTAPAGAPLLIAANELLPCRWLLRGDCESLETWLASAHERWQGLGKPTLKLFLPEGEDPQTLMRLWKPYDPLEEYVIVSFAA